MVTCLQEEMMERNCSFIRFYKQSYNFLYSLDELLSIPYLKLAVPFSLFLGGVAVLVDALIPWRSEVMVCI